MLRSYVQQANKVVKGYRRTSGNPKTMSLATIAEEEGSGEGKGVCFSEEEKVVLKRQHVKLDFTLTEEYRTRGFGGSGSAEKKTKDKTTEEAEKASLWRRAGQRVAAAFNMAALGKAVSEFFTKLSDLLP